MNEEATAANYPMIRHFNVQKNVQNSPQESVEGKWEVCTPQSVKGFTAVGYFFGRDLHKALNIPIGLMHSSWDGRYAESWTTAETLQSDPTEPARFSSSSMWVAAWSSRTTSR